MIKYNMLITNVRLKSFIQEDMMGIFSRSKSYDSFRIYENFLIKCMLNSQYGKFTVISKL